MTRSVPGLLALAVAAALALTAAPASLAAPPPRDTEPVVLSGADLGRLAVSSNVSLRLPLWDLILCGPQIDISKLSDPTADGVSGFAEGLVPACPEGIDPHSQYADPHFDTARIVRKGTPIDRFLGFRWDAERKRFEEIPFQVDERYTRYLNNTASGFSFYSGEDQHTTYAYDGPGDREGFRWRADGPPQDPCRAQPATKSAHDPVAGLDTDDEIAFMVSDAGPRAPRDAERPKGIDAVREIRLRDPLAPRAPARYVYVMRATVDGPRPSFDGSNGHVRYRRDKDADLYAFSESSYDNYGNAPAGIHCDDRGRVVRNPDGTPKIAQRRPRDGATITTKRYKFRYDGRWLMTSIRISPDGGKRYGPDLVDRWKARAFAQDPASETPCCGYEEEDNNWGGSSILLGERVGPVRAIRETWGADSGTNVVRRETFYRDEMVQRTWLRVHVIPPLDGIYAQWDFNAGVVDRFHTVTKPSGVKVDGRNDEVFGNLDDPCNTRWDRNDTSALDQGYRSLYKALQLCELPYHLSADITDVTTSGLNAALGWSVTAGPHGSIVDRLSLVPAESSVGGLAQSLLAVPYYRDDSCFDDGTGDDPGPKLKRRSGDEPTTLASGEERRCWRPSDGPPRGSDRFFQGSIATHGMHILAIADSDNARQTVPLTEIVADWRMTMLPGRHGAAAGRAYGRRTERPLVAVIRDPRRPLPRRIAVTGLR